MLLLYPNKIAKTCSKEQVLIIYLGWTISFIAVRSSPSIKISVKAGMQIRSTPCGATNPLAIATAFTAWLSAPAPMACISAPPRSLSTPGKGYHILSMNNYKIAVVNLLGRVFMPPIDCPFRTADQILSEVKDQCEVIIIDFHAEATSEKLALGYYLDGQVSCIVGTHTHIQTADERILPKGTAFISDIGMVGSWNSILGVDKEPVIQKFLTGLPTKFTVASGSETIFCAVITKIDPSTNKISEIIRIQENFKF